MDDFFTADENANAESQAPQTGDAVVVNQTGTDDFAFMNEDNPYDGADAAGDDNQNNTESQEPTQARDDPFASMVDGGGDGQYADDSNEVKRDEVSDDAQAQNEKADDEPTFLSVWQEERKLELEKRRNQEKETQQKQIEVAQQELEKFESDRAKRIEMKKKENRDKENDLREDINAVFQHGTIWEQVGKMVNLSEKMESLQGREKDRFRDLLIHLRNAK